MSFQLLFQRVLIGATCMLVMHACATPLTAVNRSVSVKAPFNETDLITGSGGGGVPPTNERRAPLSEVSTEQCSTKQISIIELSATAADEYAAESYKYMTAEGDGERPRYEWWFGKWDQNRKPPNDNELVRTHVKNAYKAMVTRPFVSGYTYDCDCEFDVIAFVAGEKYNERPKPVINLCNKFWGEDVPNSGHNSRAGTLIHEASHFHDVARSEDHDGYRDMTGTHALALNVPEVAAQSANNYRFFSENRDNRQ